MSQTKPLKRSKHLTMLSHEHHEILLFVWKIRQGMIYEVPAKVIATYCEWFWNNLLKQHFEKEEKILPGLVAEDDVMMNTMRDDHDAIRRKIQEVIEDPSYFQIQRLAQILYYHIRFEERNWFVHLEKDASEEELSAVELSLGELRIKRDAQWTNEFWKKRA